MLDESLTCLRGIWGDEPFTHAGEFYRFQNADLLPKTIQKPHQFAREVMPALRG